jgi:ABC-type Zn uptake system ZnuABC Zn-binding protein ZnuA
MRLIRILFVLASLMSLVVSGCSSVTTQSPTTKEPTTQTPTIKELATQTPIIKEPTTASYKSALEPLLQAKCINCHPSLSYDWAKKYSQNEKFIAGHWGANWTTLEVATISKWINEGMSP